MDVWRILVAPLAEASSKDFAFWHGILLISSAGILRTHSSVGDCSSSVCASV